MKKIILGAVLILFITVGFGVYYVLSNLDEIVRTAIETYGSEATQTAVRVEGVKLGLQDGSGAIHGLTVGNPKGFAARQAFSLGEVSTQINLESLSADVIIIEHITVRAPEVFYELNNAGEVNLDALNKQVSTGASKSTTAASTDKSDAAEPKLIIRKFLFVDGVVHANMVPLNKRYDLKLPKIEMQNLGGKNGATPAEIADQVIELLTDRVLAAVKKEGLDRYRKELEGKVNKLLEAEQQKLNEKIGAQLGEQVGEEVGDKLKGLLNFK
jgi:hypothetical protein